VEPHGQTFIGQDAHSDGKLTQPASHRQVVKITGCVLLAFQLESRPSRCASPLKLAAENNIHVTGLLFFGDTRAWL
jgi:hypothetical protein